VGPGATLDVDLARLDRVVARVTRALFWHHYGRRLPDGILMRVFSEGGLRDLHDADRAKVLATVIPVQRNPPQSIGRGVLRYWHAVVPGQEYATAWVLEFYGDVRFLALTLPNRSDESSEHRIP